MNKTTRLGVVVVLYNRTLEDVPSFAIARSGTADKSVRWVVVDNSDKPDSRSAEAASRVGMIYKSMNGNHGIAAAFNTGIDALGTDVDYAMFLDQDTADIDAYIGSAVEHLESWNADILMPLVMSDSLILSPCQRIGPWYRPIRRVGHRPRHFSCINSGMVVRRAILQRVRFDEALFLDYVDHKFVLDAVARGALLEPAWHLRLEQDYSRSSDSANQAHIRMAIFARDVRKFYGTTSLGRAISELVIARRRIQAAIMYRDASFMRLGPLNMRSG